MNALLREPLRSSHPTAEQPPAPYRVALAAAREPFDPARILGCSREEVGTLFHGRAVTTGEAVKRLLDQGRLPHVVHDSGVRLMRRRQIEALAELGLSCPA